MNQLSIERINEYAPYKVEAEDGQYIFETDNDILYGVFNKQIEMFRANKP